MKNIIRAFIITLPFLISSCQDVVELDLPDSEPLLAVDGWLTDQEGEKSVTLTLTANYFSDEPNPRISGATLVLYSDKGPVDTLRESETEPGRYLTGHVGAIGNVYHLYIQTPDGKEYASIPQLMKPISPIDSIFYEFKEESAFQDEGYYIKINTFEPAGKGDYYRWRQFINEVYQNDPFDLVFATDEFVDGNPILNFEVATQPAQLGDTVRVEQMSISPEAYDFLFLVQDQTAFVGSIFDTPPVPIKGNLYSMTDPDETVQGFFGVSAVSEAVVIIEE